MKLKIGTKILAMCVVTAMILVGFNSMVSMEVSAETVDNNPVPESSEQWLLGNITYTNGGDTVEVVALTFTIIRTEESVTGESTENGTFYEFDLMEFAQGYEIDDEIFIEGYGEDPYGKSWSGNTTVVITNENIIWADIDMLDPPPFELVPPNAIPEPPELPDETPEEPEDPAPAEEEPWIELVSLRIEPGYRFALEDEKADVEVTLRNVGPDAIIRATLTCIKPDGSEETIGDIHYGRLKTTWEQTKHINWWPDQVGRNWIRVEIGVKGQGNEYTIVGEHMESLWVAPSDNVVVWENMVIDTPSHYEDMTIIVLGGLRISAPTTFVNVTKIFDITTYNVDAPTWETSSWVIFDTGLGVTAYLSVNTPNGELYIEQNTYVTAGDTDFGYDFYVHNLLDVSTNSIIEYHQNGVQLLSDTVSSTFSTNAVIKDGHDYGIIATGLAPSTITDTTLFRNDLDGIYIQGPSPTITGGTFRLNGDDGIHIVGGSPTIDGALTTRIANNDGYGIFIDGGSPTIQNILELGSLTLGGNALGGIRVENNAVATIQGNVISHNTGDGISINQAFAIIENNIISDHSGGAGVRVVSSNNAPKMKIQTNPAYSAVAQQIYGNMAGIYMVNSLGFIDGNVIYASNPATDIYGIYLETASPVITGNEIEHFSAVGSCGVIVMGSSSPIIQSNNIIEDNWYGVSVSGVSSPFIDGNIFEKNVVGIDLVSLSAPTPATISGNVINTDLDYAGIRVYGCDPIIEGNTLTGLTGFSSTTRLGIYNLYSAPVISGNTITSYYYGIYNFESSPFIRDNTITGDPAQTSAGIYFEGPSTSTIFHNTIQDNKGYGIYSDGQSLIIDDNTMPRNGYGIYMANAPTSTTSFTVSDFIGGTPSPTKTVTFNNIGVPDIIPKVTLPSDARILTASMDLNRLVDFDSQGVVTSGIGDETLTSGDYDNDGDIDIFIMESSGNLLLFENDAGTFTPQGTVMVLGTDVFRLASADFDNDNVVDLLVGYWGGNVEYFRNDPPGTFNSVWAGTIGTAVHGLTSGDFDGDLNDDFLVINEVEEILLYKNDPPGTFTNQGPVATVDTMNYGLTSGDFDGDLNVDFLVGKYNGVVEFFLNDGAGGFIPQVPTYDVGDAAYGLTSADFDGDGDTDFLVGNYDGQVNYFSNDGGTFSLQEVIVAGGLPIWGLTSADFDDDKGIDFLTRDVIGEVTYFTNPYPANLRLDIGNDLTYEWTLTPPLDFGPLTIDYTNTVPPFTEALQAYLDAAAPGTVDVPLVLYASTAGTIELSNLRIAYGSTDGAAILRNDVSQSTYSGIYVTQSDYVDIYDNVLTASGTHGIYVYSSDNCLIDSNTANSNNNMGIYLYSTHNNKITNNVASYNAHGNIWDAGIALTFSNYNLIEGNTAEHNELAYGTYGIRLWWSHYNTFNDNTCNANGYSGIHIHGSTWNTFTLNTLTNNLLGGGLSLWDSNHYNDAQGNIISGNGVGIGIAQYSHHNSITNNNQILSNTNVGISLWRSEGTLISGNKINTNGDGIRLEYSKIDITNNEIIGNSLNGIIITEPYGTSTTSGDIIGNTISGNTWWGIHTLYVEPTNADTLEADNTFGDNGEGWIWQEWKLRIHTVFDGTDIQSHVTIDDSKWTEVFNDYTDATGWTPWITLTEYQTYNTGVPRDYYTPHEILAEVDYTEIYIPPEDEWVLMDANKEVTLTFDYIEKTFDFVLYAGQRNYISLPLVNPSLVYASDMAVLIGPTCTEIDMYDAATGTDKIYIVGDSSTDYELVGNYGYNVYVDSYTKATMTGYLPGHSSIVLYQGPNLVRAMPYGCELNAAEFATYLDPIFEKIGYWSKTLSTWVFYPDDVSGFTLKPGVGYLLYVGQDATFYYPEADLAVIDIVFYDDPIYSGSPTSIAATVVNVGELSVTEGINIDFYDNGYFIASTTIAGLGKGETIISDGVEWVPQTDGVHTIKAVVNCDNAVAEITKQNNDWAEPLTVFALTANTGFESSYHYVGEESNIMTVAGAKINSANGNLFIYTTDRIIKAKGFDIAIERVYNSQRNDVLGPFGYGWTHNYDIHLTENPDGTVEQVDADGSGWIFEPTGTDGYVSPPGQYADMTKNADGTFTLRYNDGMVYDFDTAGKLAAITDKNGNSLTFVYTSGLLTEIDDDSGQYLQITYNADNLIDTVTDQIGRVVQYTYQNLELVSVTESLGGEFRYEYTSAHMLENIIDRVGGTLSFTYYLSNIDGVVKEVYRSVYDEVTGTFKDTFGMYLFEYGVMTTYVTNARGVVSTIEFNEYGNPTYIGSPVAGPRFASGYREWDENMNTLQYIDKNGNPYIYGYDDCGNTLTETDPHAYSMLYTWETTHTDTKYISLQTAKTNKLGYTWTYTYDVNGNLVTTTDPLGHTETNTYTASGNVETSTASPTIEYTYDVHGWVIKMTYTEDGSNVQYAYDSVGRKNSETNENGYTTTYEYDDNDRLVKVTDPLLHFETYGYDAEGHWTSIIDKNGFTSVYAYNILMNTVGTITDPLGYVESYQYDSVGNIIEYTDKNGNSAYYQYNSENWLTAEMDALGYEALFEYDDMGNLISETDKNGHMTSYIYDELGRMAEIIGPLGYSETNSYDAEGNMETYTNKRGYVTTYYYDDLNRQVQETDAKGIDWFTAYDEYDNVISQTDGNGYITTYAYDFKDRQITETDPLGNTITYNYDYVGNIIDLTDANGNTLTYDYDALNRMISVTDQMGYQTNYYYDNKTNLVQVEDANGHSTFHEYDTLGRMTRMTSPSGYETFYTYDSVGNVLTRTDPNGITTQYEYDVLNQLVNVTYPDGSYAAYAYDGVGNHIGGKSQGISSEGVTYVTFVYNERNELLSFSVNSGYVVLTNQYLYDANGNRIEFIDALGDSTTYEYDELDGLIAITDYYGRTTTYQYDNNGMRTRMDYPNGVYTTYTYDAAERLINMESRNSTGAILVNYEYVYDNSGKRLQVTDHNGDVTQYAYDENARLTSVSYPWADIVTYTYDGVGNRLTMDVNGAVTTYTYDVENRLTSISDGTTYNYDNNGNQIEKTDGTGTTYFAYNYENRLERVDFPDSTYVIYTNCPCPGTCGLSGETRLGEKRLSKTTPEGTIYYFYDMDEDVYLEFNETGAVIARYVHGPGIDEPISMERGGLTYYYLFDGLGSVVALTDENGDIVVRYVYDAWGSAIDEIGQSIENPYRFTSREYDSESGLYYYRARTYDPVTGRFMQLDPEGMVDGPNMYAYVGNDPVNYKDPTGNWKWKYPCLKTDKKKWEDCTKKNIAYAALAFISCLIIVLSVKFILATIAGVGVGAVTTAGTVSLAMIIGFVAMIALCLGAGLAAKWGGKTLYCAYKSLYWTWCP